MPDPTDACTVRARSGWGGRLRATAVPAAGARLPLRRALVSVPAATPATAADGPLPGGGDVAPVSPARQLLERFQFCELDAMPQGRMRQVVEFLGGRGRALRTAPLRANWKALRLAFEEPALRALLIEHTDEVVEFLMRPDVAGEGRQPVGESLPGGMLLPSSFSPAGASSGLLASR
ncbi:hypothetical protein QRO08_22625 [Paracidovorax citrulli]|uniref:Uncharacterized protein n=2 Tax=Paracidovorax citrulli TaxID=80869 RepID=A1TJD1_PARC0|nr:hypothetical protein [Paracidovorax citrulli]ABM31069.1 hypothetical protein Aave_0462 [Paracidovorax citrulli AAC00-1]ACU00249.1 hypothetical protein [Paracidovorax citrulli]ATG95781.1 hypothetical protein CQB05_18530 [Paracidovorax citrulli]PVY65250.1 hypothetical protein C8E08_2603 [Paracidovorax citrulli]REG70560.1 hypothetical protein C8E07_3772 [Paracidovorax citrulli]